MKSVEPWSWETLLPLDSCKAGRLVGKETKRWEDGKDSQGPSDT